MSRENSANKHFAVTTKSETTVPAEEDSFRFHTPFVSFPREEGENKLIQSGTHLVRRKGIAFSGREGGGENRVGVRSVGRRDTHLVTHNPPENWIRRLELNAERKSNTKMSSSVSRSFVRISSTPELPNDFSRRLGRRV